MGNYGIRKCILLLKPLISILGAIFKQLMHSYFMNLKTIS